MKMDPVPTKNYFKAFKNGEEFIVMGFIESEITYMSTADSHWFTIRNGSSANPFNPGRVCQLIHKETKQNCICINEECTATFLIQAKFGCEIIATFESGTEFYLNQFLSFRVKDEIIYNFNGTLHTQYELEIRTAVTEFHVQMRSRSYEPDCIVSQLVDDAKPMTTATAAAAAAVAVTNAAIAVKTAATPMIVYAADAASTVALQAARSAAEYMRSQQQQRIAAAPAEPTR